MKLHNKTIMMLVLLVMVGLISSCNRPCDENNTKCVQIPESDQTPPQNLSLRISEEQDDDNGLVTRLVIDETFDSSQSYIVEPTTNIVFVSISGADNNGGIKSLELWMNTERCRSNGDETTCAGPGLLGAPTRSVVSSKNIGEYAYKERIIVEGLDLDEMLGSSTSLRVNVWAVAENFHGGKVRTPTVTIEYP